VSNGPVAPDPVGIWRTLRALPRPVIVLLAGIAVNRVASFVGVFLILYVTHLGYGLTAAGAAVTAFGIGSICGAYLGGVVTERFGSRWAIIASMLLSAAAAAALASEHRYGALVVVAAADGVFTQCYRPAAAALIADLIPARRLVVVTAASRLGLNVGATVAPLLGVWLITISYSLMFTVDAASSLGFALLAFVALPRSTPQASGPAAIAPAHPEAPPPPARAPRVLTDLRYLLVLAGMFVASAAEIQYQTTLPLQIHARNLPTWVYGVIVALNGAIVITCELPLTRCVQKLPIRTAIASGVFLIGAGIAFFGLSGQIWVFFLGAGVWTAGETTSSPSLNSYPALIAPPARRSRYIAALTSCQNGGYAAGPIIGTVLFAQRHSYTWFMCAAFGAVACACMLAGVRYRPASGTPPGPPPSLASAASGGTPEARDGRQPT